jgi:uncharacterized repeat protein (TIGR01451 family)
MKNILILLFLAFCGVANGQIINFPDPNFKNALVNTKCVDTDGDGVGDADADLNNDGEIDMSEALEVERLEISSNEIISIEGIQHFKELKLLNCLSNKIQSLNVNSLNKLEEINCGYNLLTSLNFENLLNLKEVYCYYNNLTALTFSNTPNLTLLLAQNNKLITFETNQIPKIKRLTLRVNELSTLNINGLQKLESLEIGGNQISSIEFINLPALIVLSIGGVNKFKYLEIKDLPNLEELNLAYSNTETLKLFNLPSLLRVDAINAKLNHVDLIQLPSLSLIDVKSNQLKKLDVRDLPELDALLCSENLLEELLVENVPKIQTLYCRWNNLKALYYKENALPPGLDFNNNPNLKYICTTDKNSTRFRDLVLQYEIDNVLINSYCDFNPFGDIGVVKGNFKYDGDGNGCNQNDLSPLYLNFDISKGNETFRLILQESPYYIHLNPGTYFFKSLNYATSNEFEISPKQFDIKINAHNDTITQDICITPKGIFRQTNITVIPLTPPARPGFDASYKIVWENVGNQVESGTLNFTYDERLLDYISATQTADQIADGIIKWNFTNLLPFEKREITVTLKVNRPTDTPAVNAGDKLYLTASILDNIFTLENTVVGSYDPNDKTCLQGDRVKPDMVGEYVDYLIRFENTGNYAAENVVVKDIIDTKTFDISTLKITDASHEVYTRKEGNKVEFIFENINLPFDDANNDGYIAFKIKTLPSLVLGDSLKNLADIYFDYNFPIRTNEAQTTVAFPVFTKDITTEVNIYPNPVSDILYLNTNVNWTKAEIYDISSRIMRSVSLNGQSIDVSGLESGTYFIRLKDGDRVGLVKFVKM